MSGTMYCCIVILHSTHNLPGQKCQAILVLISWRNVSVVIWWPIMICNDIIKRNTVVSAHVWLWNT